MNESWVHFIEVILGGGGLGAIFAFIKWYLGFRKSRTERLLMSGLESIQNINGLLDQIINNSQFERVVIFRGHDDGDLPTLLNPYYLSSLFWSAKLNIDEVFGVNQFKNQELSHFGVKLMNDLYKEKLMEFKVCDMSSDKIKSYFHLANQSNVIFSYLGIRDKQYFMLAASTSQSEISDTDRELFKLISNSITNEFNF